MHTGDVKDEAATGLSFADRGGLRELIGRTCMDVSGTGWDRLVDALDAALPCHFRRLPPGDHQLAALVRST
jgi:hypothetical protein